MARTYRTLSLSLPPEVVEQLELRGKTEGKTAARVAVELVLREVSISVPQIEFQVDDQEDGSKVLHQCIVHEPTRQGMFAREHQTISLLDITRIRAERIDAFEVFINGRWIEVEGKLDDFKPIWEYAKKMAAGIR